MNNNTQAIVDSLTSLLLAKYYYHSFHSGHYTYYYCHIQHMMLRKIIDMGHNYKYLNGALALDKFEESDPPYPFYEEWLNKTIFL